MGWGIADRYARPSPTWIDVPNLIVLAQVVWAYVEGESQNWEHWGPAPRDGAWLIL